jgi:hypothetical protein
VVGVRRAARGKLPHCDDLVILLADEEDARRLVEVRNDLAVPALEGGEPHRVERAEGHSGPQGIKVDRRQAAADAIRLRRADPTKAQMRPYEPSVEVVGASAPGAFAS